MNQVLSVKESLQQWTVREYIEQWVRELRDAVEKYYTANFPRSKVPVVSVAYGKVYAKVVSDGSAFAFVKLVDGTIWKPASWSAPAKNFPRGNVTKDDRHVWISPFGVRNAR